MLPDIRNILYATDLSKNANYALKYALSGLYPQGREEMKNIGICIMTTSDLLSLMRSRLAFSGAGVS